MRYAVSVPVVIVGTSTFDIFISLLLDPCDVSMFLFWHFLQRRASHTRNLERRVTAAYRKVQMHEVTSGQCLTGVGLTPDTVDTFREKQSREPQTSFEIDRFMFIPSFGTAFRRILDPSHDPAGHRGSSFMCTSQGVKVSKWVRGVVIGCLPRKRF